MSAACKGMPTDLFFSGRSEVIAEARRVCAGCDERDTCRARGESEPEGIWGGVQSDSTTADRAKIVAALSPRFTAAEIGRATGLSSQCIGRHLQRLAADGVVVAVESKSNRTIWGTR